MAVDIRAKVFCNLGPLISGNISDEPLTAGQGLIRCRGQLVLNGLFTPAVGAVVTLGYQSNGYVARIPRVLRVLGSFADPFRNITTVSVGDKLVLLADKKSHVEPLQETTAPEVAALNEVFNFKNGKATIPRKWNGACWQQITPEEADQLELISKHPLTDGFQFDTVAVSQKVTAAEQYSKSPLKNFLTVKPSLSASFIAMKCLSGLGIAGAPGLTNSYNVAEFDLSEGYVSVLEKLLSSEGKVGFLDESEILRVVDINGAVGGGVLISSEDIIDLGPLNIGTPPADELVVLTTKGENIITEPQIPNVAPVANDFRLTNKGYVNNQPIYISASKFISNGFDPDYRAQKAVGASTTLRLESVTGGQGCSVTITSASLQQGIREIAVIPDPGYVGPASVSYVLTDGNSSSNSASCYFALVANPAQAQYEAALEEHLAKKAADADAAYDRAGIDPNNGRAAPGTAASANASTEEQSAQAEQQQEVLKRNWEFEESFGAEKTVAVGYETVVDFQTQTNYANYTYTPYSCAISEYDALDRKTKSYTYQEGITAEVAGSIVKAQLESNFDQGGEYVSWLTEEFFFYYTELESEEKFEDSLTEYGRRYEEWKEQERLAYEEALEKNRLENIGSTGLLKTIPQLCDLGFMPNDNPQAGDEYVMDGLKFVYNQTTGWTHQKADYAPIATSYPGAIYTKDFTQTTKTTRQRLVSYMTSQHAYRYGPAREVLGGLSLPFDKDFWYMPPNLRILTDQTITYYDVDWYGGKVKTTTHRYTLNCNTIQGQQLIAKMAENIQFAEGDNKFQILDGIIEVALEMVYQGAEVGIRSDREYGIQQRPSIYEREWEDVIGGDTPDPDVFGDYEVVDRNAKPRNSAASIEQKSKDDEIGPVVLNITPPYTTGPERKINEDGSATFVENQAQTQAMTYGRAFNNIARGSRYGVSLQVPVSAVPISPLSWIYLEMKGQTAGYRANGVSYVFNESGLLCNVDALFWGGVGISP